MDHARPTVIVLDTSVLLNFLRIDRLDLISRHSGDYVITDHVAGEITAPYPEQQARFNAALGAGALKQVSVNDPVELDIFGSLAASGRLGAGECSAIALAVNRRYCLAIDDRRAAREGRRISQGLEILSTQSLMIAMIGENLLDVHEADAIKDSWAAQYRFRLPFQSFEELLGGG